MKMLAIDLDGVMAGFDEHVADLFGAPPSDLGDDRMWELANAHDSFWTGMPLKAGALDLWAAALPFGPVVLTGCPKSDYERAAAHKREWVAKHLGADVPVITCLSKDKALHMRNPGDVLVDDRHSNIKRWRKAGGIAVLYRNAEQAKADMLAALMTG